jgi:hypothetical protein
MVSFFTPASISSLSEFHAAFVAYYQDFYPSVLVCHNCSEGYHNSIPDEVVSDVGYEDDPEDLNQSSILSPPHSSTAGGAMRVTKFLGRRMVL